MSVLLSCCPAVLLSCCPAVLLPCLSLQPASRVSRCAGSPVRLALTKGTQLSGAAIAFTFAFAFACRQLSPRRRCVGIASRLAARHSRVRRRPVSANHGRLLAAYHLATASLVSSCKRRSSRHAFALVNPRHCCTADASLMRTRPSPLSSQPWSQQCLSSLLQGTASS